MYRSALGSHSTPKQLYCESPRLKTQKFQPRSGHYEMYDEPDA